MIDPKIAALQSQQAIGEEYQRVFDSYIKPFIEEKRTQLFEAFQMVPVGNVDALKDIKVQTTAINALEAHFREFANTGKLAKHQLEN